MNKLKLLHAKLALSCLLGTGLVIHVLRIIAGIDAVQRLILTRAFDSAFAAAMAIVALLVWRARNSVDWRGTGERVLVWGTLAYVGLSVLLHARSWFVADHTEVFRAFPVGYSVVFSLVATTTLVLWWRLRPRGPALRT